MANDTDMAAELVGGAYEAHKASIRRGTGSGVEVRVRTVRRRSWSAEDKLRIVSETLAPGAVAKVVADRRDYREFRVCSVMMGKKELSHGPTQIASDPR